MGEDVILVANVVIGGLFATAVGFAIAWMRARERAIRAELTRQRLPAEHDTALDRLQQSVEAIAVEVERIAEAQRFSAKLLAEQSPAGAHLAVQPETLPRIVTPH